MPKKKETMVDIKRFIEVWWKKGLVVFAAISGILSFLTIFFEIKFDFWQFFAIVSVALVGTAVWARYDFGSKSTRKINIHDRLGSSHSMNDVYPDKSHKFTLIKRQDLLDYKVSQQDIGKTAHGRNFVSIRFLEGYNASNNPTDGIVYLECSEYKSFYREIKIIAYDMNTNKELKVEFLGLEENKKYTDFPFKILFSKPLKPGECFKIVFSITLKNELDVLTDDDEIMSICLLRYKKGVDKLDFNVCLDFDPQSVNVLSQKKLGGDTFDFSGDEFTVERYVPKSEWEILFDIKWSSQPYIIQWGCEKPRWKFYVINYRR